MLRVRSRLLSLCAFLLLAAASADAQEFRATVKGQVADTSQAALPGATVSVKNQDTNEVATATTNGEGSYTIPFLRPGLYTLTVEMSGFQTNTRTNMRLEVGQIANVNVALGVGLTETVNVSSEAPLLETGNADRGQVIDAHRVAELPLQSRSPMALAVLVAGVNYNAQAIYLRPFDNGALADWSMNGGQNRNNEFLLDGAPNNANQGGNNIAYVPPAEAVQEFKVSTNSYDAQYGRTAGGVVNMSLKSGTNTLHGVGYEFFRRKSLDSNSFLLNARSSPKTDHYLDQYGLAMDGPVVIPGLYDGRNKTFFMFSGEKYREGTPAPLFSTTPTDAMKAGDFSGLVDASGRRIIIYDPATGRDVNGVWTRDPFPGNIIPANRINAAARAIMQYYPSPNGSTAGVAPWQQNLHYAEHINKDLFWNWVGKVDHNFTPNDRTYFRWGENERNEVRNTSAIRSGPAQDGQLPLIRANRAIVGDWVHVFNSGTVFNIRGGYTYFLEWSQSDASFGFNSTEFGWPASLVDQLPGQGLGGMFPRIDMADFVSLSRGTSPNTNRNYSIQPNISMSRGKHNIRGGLDVRWTNVFSENYANAGGFLNFTQQFTRSTLNSTSVLEGNSFASFLLGAPNNGEVPVNVFPKYQWFFIAPWIQDDWRVNDKLTVNLGFRWDGNGAVREKENRLNYAFDTTLTNPVSARVGQPVIGGIRFAGVDGAPETPWKFDKNNFQLRAGLAYSLNEKTVLRAGYGKYYLNPTAQSFNNGFSLATPFISSNDGGRTPTYALGNPFPNGVQQPAGSALGPLTFLGRNPSFSNPDFIVPNVHQFSAGFQRELPFGISLDVTYAGSRSYDIQSNWNGFNEPSAEFQARCDVTLGGSRALCDQLVANPFFGVPGFEGTGRFTGATISRFELARPYNAFTNFSMTERNDGHMSYDSMQLTANKRWAKGLTLNATYTWVPRWTETGANTTTGIGEAFVDGVSRLENTGPYFSHREHRVTASGVWELPGRGRRDLVGMLIGGWSVAPVFIFQSGQPWTMPGNVDLAVDPAIAALPGNKEGQFIYGVKPCVGQRNAAGGYDLLSYSVAYGCTEPFFLVREAFQRRTAMFRYDEFRRPSFWQVDLNFAKTTPITSKMRMQVRVEAFNIFNSPMYDEREYNQTTTSADFGRINRNSTGQSNFQRFVQLGFRFTF
jgi:Carboxypeptidase regulatory-like domain/TonB-dependent Receptor Plug Domain/TonB dependent receptor